MNNRDLLSNKNTIDAEERREQGVAPVASKTAPMAGSQYMRRQKYQVQRRESLQMRMEEWFVKNPNKTDMHFY